MTPIITALAAVLISAAYLLAPAHTIHRVRVAAKTMFGAPPIICANTVVENAADFRIVAFDDHERMANDNFSPQAGQMVLANEARFDSSFYNEPLTEYTVGWLEKNDIIATLRRICPDVMVGRRFEFKKGTNAEAYLSEADDIRAIGSDFKRVEYTGTSVNEKTLNKGLTIRVDDDEQKSSDWQERNTRTLLQRLFRNELRRAIALLSGAATNTNVTWDATAGKDPDGDLLTAIELSGDDRGIEPNKLLFGSTAWRRRSLSHRAQNTAGGFASAAMKPSELAELLSVDDVIVSRERYQSSASAKSQIVANKVIVYESQDNIGKDDPSNIKRFVSAVEGGGIVRVYVQRMNSKATDITVEFYSNIVMTDTLGVRQYTVS